MSISKIRHKVTIKKLTEVPYGTSQTARNFTDIYSCYGEILPVSGYTTFDTKQIAETITHKIKIRYHKYVTSENWVFFKSRAFRIRSVRNIDERNRWLELLCEENNLDIDKFKVGSSEISDPLSQLSI